MKILKKHANRQHQDETNKAALAITEIFFTREEERFHFNSLRHRQNNKSFKHAVSFKCFKSYKSYFINLHGKVQGIKTK